MSIGGICGPLVIEPFLLEHIELPPKSINVSLIADNITNNESIIETTFGETNVMYGYLIGGTSAVIISAMMFVAHSAYSGIYVQRQAKGDHQERKSTPRNLMSLKITFVVLLALFYVFQSIAIRTYGSYILAFSVNYLGWSKSDGANLTSVYFASSVAAKVILIFLVRQIKLEFLLFVGSFLCNVASLCLAFLVTFHWTIMWVFSCMLSVGISVLLAVMLAWTDKYVGLRGFIGVTNSVAGSVGDIIFAALTGFLFEQVSYISFLYLLAGCCVICLIILVILQILGMRFKAGLEKYQKGNVDNARSPLL
jgi:Na+/melibiose symporter-like transporter